MSKTGPKNRLLILIHSKLSENHKINVIGPTKVKLWPFKEASFNAYNIYLPGDEGR